jgi:hypothetical protein
MEKVVVNLLITCASIAQIEMEAETEEAAIDAATAMVDDDRICVGEDSYTNLQCPEEVTCLSLEQDEVRIEVIVPDGAGKRTRRLKNGSIA